MSETLQMVFAFLGLMLVFLLTRWGVGMKIRSACDGIIKDLEAQGAFSPDTAVPLAYDHTHLLRIGMRDYRPKALQSLLQADIVFKTESGEYYLGKGPDGAKPLKKGGGNQI